MNNDRIEKEIREILDLPKYWNWPNEHDLKSAPGRRNTARSTELKYRRRLAVSAAILATAAVLAIALIGPSFILESIRKLGYRLSGDKPESDILMVRKTEASDTRKGELQRPQESGTDGPFASEWNHAEHHQYEDTKPTTYPPSQTEWNGRHYRFDSEIFDTSIDGDYGVMLASNRRILLFELGADFSSGARRVVLHNLADRSEIDIPINTNAFVMRENEMYYVYPYAYGLPHPAIRRYNYLTEEDDLFYTSAEGDVSSLLALDGKYLAWYEYIYDAERNGAFPTEWDESGRAQNELGYACRLVVFDLEQASVVYMNDKVLIDKRSERPFVFADGFVAIVSSLETGERVLELVDFINDRTAYSYPIDELPQSIDYANGILAMVDWNHTLFVGRIHEPGSTVSVASDLNFVHCPVVLDGRFVAYVVQQELNILDINSMQIVYSTREDDNVNGLSGEGESRYIFSSFTADRDHRLLAAEVRDRQEGGFRTFVLQVKDLDGAPVESASPTPFPASDSITESNSGYSFAGRIVDTNNYRSAQTPFFYPIDVFSPLTQATVLAISVCASFSMIFQVAQNEKSRSEQPQGL